MEWLTALSGLERIVIIAGAMVIGFWGYRLFATAPTPALVFMGIACAVLFGALLTGGSHLKSVGQTYRLATTPATAGTASTPGAAETATPDGSDAGRTAALTNPEDSPAPTAAEPAPAAPGPGEPLAVAEAGTAPAQKPPALLSSQELGGRIVGIRSDSVTLEWSAGERR